MTLRVADTPELLGWILSFGVGIRVVKPPVLREKVREEAKKILNNRDPICHSLMISEEGHIGTFNDHESEGAEESERQGDRRP